MINTPKKPTDLATIEDVLQIRASISKEVGDILEASAMLRDDDPHNDASAMLEIAQSLGVIGASIVVVAGGFVYIAQALGML